MPLLPRIYADFNAIEYPEEGGSIAEMPLTGYGTLASLSRQGLKLEEGMSLVLYEPSDIECEAVATFDQARTNPAGRPGEWVARLNHKEIRSNLIEWDEPSTHPCSGCGKDLNDLFRGEGRSYNEHCPACGTSVMAPMAPPKGAA